MYRKERKTRASKAERHHRRTCEITEGEGDIKEEGREC